MRSNLTEEEVRRKYALQNFREFLDAFKWVTSFLREPQDYALITADFAEQLLSQNVVYAEVTLSIGVMLLRGQRPEENFAAILRATEPFAKRGLRINWIFDAVRQFGVDAASRVRGWGQKLRPSIDCGVRHGWRRIKPARRGFSKGI